jgi:hypothetical protein
LITDIADPDAIFLSFASLPAAAISVISGRHLIAGIFLRSPQ